LRRLGAKPIHLSLWSLRTDAFSGQSLFEHLRQYIDANDRLAVITATSAFGISITPMQQV
jgi:hypothetical protein